MSDGDGGRHSGHSVLHWVKVSTLFKSTQARRRRRKTTFISKLFSWNLVGKWHQNTPLGLFTEPFHCCFSSSQPIAAHWKWLCNSALKPYCYFFRWRKTQTENSLPACPCFCLSVFPNLIFFGTSLFCRAVTAPPCHVDDLTWRSLLSNQPAIALSSQLISVFLCLVCLLSVSPIPAPSVCLSSLRVPSCQWEVWSRQSCYERLWKVEVAVLTSSKGKKTTTHKQKTRKSRSRHDSRCPQLSSRGENWVILQQLHPNWTMESQESLN